MFALCQPDEKGVCTQCGIATEPGVRRTCPNMNKFLTQKYQEFTKEKPTEPIKEPSIGRRIYSYCVSMKNWRDAGKPLRSHARVTEILSICLSCEWLLEKGTAHQRCGKCGCFVNANMDVPIILGIEQPSNKLLLATESCPLEPPKWTADV